MPLLDHFNPPLNRTHPWRSFHGAWAAAMARLLNQAILPAGYYALPLVVELPADGAKVRVYADDRDPRLKSTIEFVGPRNMDSPQCRQAFAVKCIGYLRQGSSVVVVDAVTSRWGDLRGDLNAAILSRLGADASAAAPRAGLAAMSYRAVGREEAAQQLQIWQASLALGHPLPTLPLWIAGDLSVPLDLEASYQATCTDLRIRQVG